MKLSEMREWLDERDIQLTKSLGQNFLHDAHQLDRIVMAAELTKADKVLEIGPGLGPLTELLLARAGEVLAIEKDTRLVEVLRERFANDLASARPTPTLPMNLSLPECPLTQPSPPVGERVAVRVDGGNLVRAGLQLLHADALDFLRREPRDWSDWKLVANLPYSVASPILVELAQTPKRPERMVVTLQLEVAQRLMAGADDDDYGVLTLLIQLDYEARGWFKIPSSCFFPVPDVDSACVTLVRRAQPMLAEENRAAFVKIVKRAFSQRRKMMMKLLKTDWPAERLATAFAKLQISPQERAEKLSLEKFVKLARTLNNP